jgi:hypothetical protein
MMERREFLGQSRAAHIARFSLSLFSATCTSRLGSRNGSGRSNTAFTTLKIVVFAPIASITVKTTAVVISGVRRIILSACRISANNKLTLHQ